MMPPFLSPAHRVRVQHCVANDKWVNDVMPTGQRFLLCPGLGGRCGECDEPILLADLLELEVMP